VKNTTYNLTSNLNVIRGFRCSDVSNTNIVFNGNGYVITAVNNRTWPGLFPCDVSVNNLVMDSSGSSLNESAGPGWFFIGRIGGTATNCQNKGPIGGGCGGIFGIRSSGTAIRCYNSGTIGAAGGGIFGVTSSGTATNCYNTGTIDISAGGIFGGGSNGTAANCYNTGVIGESGGGIYGFRCNLGMVENCYNTGDIGPSAGGIMGADSTGNSTITNCYNTGSIGVDGGGIIGARANGTVTNCYNAGAIGGAGLIVGANSNTISVKSGSTSGWLDDRAIQFLTDFPSSIPGSGTIWISLTAGQPFVLTNNPPPPTTMAPTTTTTPAPTTTTTTIVFPNGVVRYNSSFIEPVYSTNTKAYFRILNSGTVSTKIACSGVLVGNGIDGENPFKTTDPGTSRKQGSNSGGMRPITLTANITYTVDISMNSSISDGYTVEDTSGLYVALGGTFNTNGQDNIFGKGKGGAKLDGEGVAFSGSGYGGGGGAGTGAARPSGGGGGFDPNAYYSLATDAIQGVPISDQISKTYRGIYGGYQASGVGKPGVLFLEITKP